MVWGRTVKFDRSTINTFYGLAEVDDSAYRALKDNADYQKVISFLTRAGSGAKWRMRNGEYRLLVNTLTTQLEYDTTLCLLD